MQNTLQCIAIKFLLIFQQPSSVKMGNELQKLAEEVGNENVASLMNELLDTEDESGAKTKATDHKHKAIESESRHSDEDVYNILKAASTSSSRKTAKVRNYYSK